MNSNELKKKIGSRIVLARKANRLTVKELSERTGFGATRISNWEQGTRCPGPQEAMLLAKEMRVAASWILFLTNLPSGEKIDDCIF